MYVLEYINTLRKGLPLLSKVSDPKKANLHFFTTFSYKKSSQKLSLYAPSFVSGITFAYVFCTPDSKLATSSNQSANLLPFCTTKQAFFLSYFWGPFSICEISI